MCVSYLKRLLSRPQLYVCLKVRVLVLDVRVLILELDYCCICVSHTLHATRTRTNLDVRILILELDYCCMCE